MSPEDSDLQTSSQVNTQPVLFVSSHPRFTLPLLATKEKGRDVNEVEVNEDADVQQERDHPTRSERKRRDHNEQPDKSLSPERRELSVELQFDVDLNTNGSIRRRSESNL